MRPREGGKSPTAGAPASIERKYEDAGRKGLPRNEREKSIGKEKGKTKLKKKRQMM